MSTQIPCKEVYKELFELLKDESHDYSKEEERQLAVNFAFIVMEAAKKEKIDLTAGTVTLSEYTKLLVRLVK